MAAHEIKNACVGPDEFQAVPLPLTARNLPPADEVHLWYLDLSVLSAPLADALSSPAEGSPGAAGLNPGQLRFLRRFYLRLLLGAYLGRPGRAVKIVRSPRGKPVLDRSVHGNSLQFSMAKSGDRQLVGIANGGDIGVDLEVADRRARNPLGVARRYFSATEAAALAARPPESLDAAFLRAWACKEALVKASGQGIANELCRFTVETDPTLPPAVLEFAGRADHGWNLVMAQPEAGYLGAVARTVHSGGETGVKAFRLLAQR